MSADTPKIMDRPAEQSLKLFTDCHDAIKAKMEVMRSLPPLVTAGTDPKLAAAIAEDILAFFESIVMPHHHEEERELWPVLDRTKNDAEGHETVKSVIHRLRDEHEALEKLWREVEAWLRKVARGKKVSFDTDKAIQLSRMYDEHAAFEDAVVMPLASYLLKPADHYRIAMSIALSRNPVRAYI